MSIAALSTNTGKVRVAGCHEGVTGSLKKTEEIDTMNAQYRNLSANTKLMFIGYSFPCHLAVLEKDTYQFTSIVFYDWHGPT